MDATQYEGEMDNKYRKTFQEYDPNNTGVISLEDMSDILRKLGRKISSSELKELLTEACDADIENNNINFNLFVPFMELTTNANSIYEDEMYLVFQHFDKDGDGYICPEELRDLFSSLGDDITEKDLLDMITEADHDGDGKVSFSDFVKVMTHPHQQHQIEASIPSTTKPCFTLEDAIPEEDHSEESREKCEREDDVTMDELDESESGSFSKLFKSKSKRRQSCLPVVGSRKSSIISVPSLSRLTLPRPKSRGSCPDITSLNNELDRPGELKKRSSLSASASFVRGLFKKKGK